MRPLTPCYCIVPHACLAGDPPGAMAASDSDVSSQLSPGQVESSDSDTEQADQPRKRKRPTASSRSRKRRRVAPGGLKRIGAKGHCSLGKYGQGMTVHCKDCCGESFKGPHVAAQQATDDELMQYLQEFDLTASDFKELVSEWLGEFVCMSGVVRKLTAQTCCYQAAITRHLSASCCRLLLPASVCPGDTEPGACQPHACCLRYMLAARGVLLFSSLQPTLCPAGNQRQATS